MVRVARFGGLLVSLALAMAASVSGSDARDMKIVRKAPVAASVPAPAPVVRDVTPQKAPPSQASLPAAGTSACVRKVKVIYAGYGEAERVNCTMASADTVSASGLRTETH